MSEAGDIMRYWGNNIITKQRGAGRDLKQFYIFIREDITEILQRWKVLRAINEDYEVTEAAARLDYKARQLLALSK